MGGGLVGGRGGGRRGTAVGFRGGSGGLGGGEERRRRENPMDFDLTLARSVKTRPCVGLCLGRRFF